MRRVRGVLLALAVVLIVAGCSSAFGRGGAQAQRGSAAPAPTGPPCVVSPTPASGGTATPPATDGGGSPGAATEPMPDISLPCFVGGRPVRLAHLGTPTVINLWASWCAPCRTELPQVQRYADRAAGRVQVIGVITNDPVRSRPQSLIDDLALRFPMLDDQHATLQTRMGARVLPMTLLVDAQGRIVYRYSAQPLDEAALADLVRRHLGVAV
jgi:thiol-disulfide isomerase/thioredoxin